MNGFDFKRLSEDLRATFPDLGAVTPRRVLGAGFRSIAVETDEGLVFRIARNAAAVEGYEKETRLLPFLSNRLPVQVPESRWHAGPSIRFPFGVIGYARLPGMPLKADRLLPGDADRLASQVAAFLLALHQVPVEELERLGLPGPDAHLVELETMRSEVLSPLRGTLDAGEYQAVARWWETFLARYGKQDYAPTLQHGDLWYENILIEGAPPSITGVVDWEEAAIGDPAQDFATQFHMGESFASSVLRAYQRMGGTSDEEFLERVRWLWQLREFDGVQFAVRIGDKGEFRDAVRKLRSGPVFNDHS